MPSPKTCALVLLLALGICTGSSAAAAAMSANEVRAAASLVAADPLLPGKETTKTLRFKQEQPQDKAVKEANKVEARWWGDLLDNLSTGMRVAMWLVGAGLLIWVLLRLRDWAGRTSSPVALSGPLPTHVGTLDIRPESLPADIGAAARRLWQRGEQRAALSLLYRGALSRLVHAHGVAIRAASTERECLALAAARLAPGAQTFLVQLVTSWQSVAYARRQLAEDSLEALCQGFDAQLPAAAPAVA